LKEQGETTGRRGINDIYGFAVCFSVCPKSSVAMEAAGLGAVCQGFKVPSIIPHLLIQGLFSPIISPTKQVTPPVTLDDYSLDSSDEEELVY
jgi:hypothetical protein